MEGYHKLWHHWKPDYNAWTYSAEHWVVCFAVHSMIICPLRHLKALNLTPKCALDFYTLHQVSDSCQVQLQVGMAPVGCWRPRRGLAWVAAPASDDPTIAGWSTDPRDGTHPARDSRPASLPRLSKSCLLDFSLTWDISMPQDIPDNTQSDACSGWPNHKG